MPPFFDSIVLLSLILFLARIIKRRSGLLQQYFIPSSLVAGAIGLILGPQIAKVIPLEVTSYWSQFPAHLITVVFAGLFLGKNIPGVKEIWRNSGPMIAFGNTLAWGQYVLGIGLAMVVLTPFFGTNPLIGALIEMSFEGGHGTAAGLAPTLEKLGWPEGTDIALGIATLSIIAAIVSGIIMLNIYNRRRGVILDTITLQEQKKHLIKSGYDLTSLSRKFESNPTMLLTALAAFSLSIGIGWCMLQGLIFLEELVLSGFTDLRFFTYVPLFPLAMIGGLIVQVALKKMNKTSLIDRKTIRALSTMALDFLIASALATVSLSVIGSNLAEFVILSVAGIIWILGCFVVLAPRMFSQHWFEYGLTNIGQSMGMTATGLLLNRLVDPDNKTKARESFAYKQLIFEPFMGGGIVTAVAPIVIFEFGSLVAFIISFILFLFWLILGLLLPRINK